ncbi:H-NS histone family protein [Acinetobacter baumannii]|nr:H-NS histone family protein [Acinetobacter baumannii]
MSKLEIENLSIEELKNLQEEAEALIASKKDQAIVDAYNQIIEIAENTGFSVEQLLEFGAQKRKKSARKSVEPRYRNKSNPEETWTGRGKQPKWLVAEIEKGAKLEDFLI